MTSNNERNQMIQEVVASSVVIRWKLLKLASLRSKEMQVNLSPVEASAGMAGTLSGLNWDEILNSTGKALDKFVEPKKQMNILLKESKEMLLNTIKIITILADLKNEKRILKDGTTFYYSEELAQYGILISLHTHTINKINIEPGVDDEDLLSLVPEMRSENINLNLVVRRLADLVINKLTVSCDHYAMFAFLLRVCELTYPKNTKLKTESVFNQLLSRITAKPELLLRIGEEFAEKGDTEIAGCRENLDYLEFIEASYRAFVNYMTALFVYKGAVDPANGDISKEADAECYGLNEKAVECKRVLFTSYGACSYYTVIERLALIDYPDNDILDALIDSLNYAYNSTPVICRLHYEACKKILTNEASFTELSKLNEKSVMKRWSFFETSMNMEIEKMIDERGLKYESYFLKLGKAHCHRDLQRGFL